MDGPEIGRLPAYIAIPEKGAETDPSMYVRTGAGISWLPRNGWSREAPRWDGRAAWDARGSYRAPVCPVAGRTAIPIFCVNGRHNLTVALVDQRNATLATASVVFMYHEVAAQRAACGMARRTAPTECTKARSPDHLEYATCWLRILPNYGQASWLAA